MKMWMNQKHQRQTSRLSSLNTNATTWNKIEHSRDDCKRLYFNKILL